MAAIRIFSLASSRVARANESLVDTGMGTGARRGYKNTR
jgi:hypothetical protein